MEWWLPATHSPRKEVLQVSENDKLWDCPLWYCFYSLPALCGVCQWAHAWDMMGSSHGTSSAFILKMYQTWRLFLQWHKTSDTVAANVYVYHTLKGMKCQSGQLVTAVCTSCTTRLLLFDTIIAATNWFNECGTLTGLAGVRGQLGLFTSPYSSCIELRLAAPGDGTVLCGVGGWLWYGPPTTDPSLRDFGVQLGSSPDAESNPRRAYNTHLHMCT